MYFLITLFVIFVNLSLFSCTPPERTSPILILSTSTDSTNRMPRNFNSLQETTSQKKEIVREISPRKIKKLKEEEKIALSNSYYEWPGIEVPVRFSTIAFVCAISCNDAVYP